MRKRTIQSLTLGQPFSLLQSSFDVATAASAISGLPASVVEAQGKGMAVTRSFGGPVRGIHTLMVVVAQYAMRAGEKLRQLAWLRAGWLLPHQSA